MQKLHFDFEQPQLEVNGIVFDVLKSDGDIMLDALELQERCKDINTNDPEAVKSAIRAAADCIDGILGEGALKKISGGRPVNLQKSIDVMVAVARAAAESMNDYMAAEYGE